MWSEPADPPLEKRFGWGLGGQAWDVAWFYLPKLKFSKIFKFYSLLFVPFSFLVPSSITLLHTLFESASVSVYK